MRAENFKQLHKFANPAKFRARFIFAFTKAERETGLFQGG